MTSQFVPGSLWLDDTGVHINAHGGCVLKVGDSHYWFGEHKTEGSEGNKTLVGVHCYSSQDLYNWHDEGIVLSVSEDPVSDIRKGCIIERPKVLCNKSDNSFVMWFHLELEGRGYEAARCGVAVSKAVTGPYEFTRSFRPHRGLMPADEPNVTDPRFLASLDKGQMSRDMTLFTDDDGCAYHSYASEENSTLHIAELTPDYLGHTGKFIRVLKGEWGEAPMLFKRDDKYHLIVSECTGWAPNRARWFSAASIWGPWINRGNPCHGPRSDKTFGSQGSFAVLHGDTWIFVGDIWDELNPIHGRYCWLPMTFSGDELRIEWVDSWSLESRNS